MIEAIATTAPLTRTNAGQASLSEATREFEGLLVGTLLRLSSQPIAGEGLLDGGSAGRMYRELFFQEIARIAAQRDGFGLGALLEASARRNEPAEAEGGA